MGENKVMGKKAHWGTMRAWVKIARESMGTWVTSHEVCILSTLERI